ncbi:hypothetical protein BJY17_003198 [Agromyces hippuratus]|uniref:Alpha/beta hydrolase n=2 Tax=Agromyces hippuratus TaxID=286438 RepID=A0A852X944_9MICO|nr:hypothetical protein [Agromyces hippuratus]NYG22451.1 hypothetical protein [Agromyces hippuratus]
MGDAQPPPPSPDERFAPVFGAAAFEGESPGAIASRAGHFLAMGTAAFGSREQTADVRDDAEALGVPFVVPATDDDLLWSEQSNLDRLTRFALQDHGSSDARDWSGGAPPRAEDELALWQNVELTHSVPSLLALLNHSRASEHELQRVAAATALRTFSNGALAAADEVLAAATTSTDEHVAAIANTALRRSDGGGSQPAAPTRAPTGGGAPPAFDHAEVSLAIHGTWAQVTADPWYAPGEPLHNHIQVASTPNLYDEDTYYTWSGEYTQAARDAGSAELPIWRDALALPPFDTVFAHSHGGNVALTAAADGERIRMLVLMHTPALPRSDAQWAAIRGHVGRTVVMRTRLDHVVLADGLVNGSSQRFDQNKLPHHPVVLHWANADAWFSHTFFTEVGKWLQYDLAGTVRRQHRYAEQLV